MSNEFDCFDCGGARVDLAALDGGEHHAEAVGHLATRLEPLRRRQTRESARQLGAELSRSVMARASVGSGDVTSVWNVRVLARRVDDAVALRDLTLRTVARIKAGRRRDPYSVAGPAALGRAAGPVHCREAAASR